MRYCQHRWEELEERWDIAASVEGDLAQYHTDFDPITGAPSTLNIAWCVLEDFEPIDMNLGKAWPHLRSTHGHGAPLVGPRQIRLVRGLCAG